MAWLDLDGVIYLWGRIKAQFAEKSEIPQASSTTPEMDGTASAGSGTTWAKADHVHPTDTSRAPLASPALTGTPTAPTATSGTNTTQIATTAFVKDAIDNLDTSLASMTGTLAVNQGGTGATTLTGLVKGNGTSAMSAASASDVVTLLGTTAVNRATADSAGNNIADTYAKKTDMAGAYIYKGSVQNASGLPNNPTTGDVYNIESASSYGAAGANVAWNGTGWDSLGEIFTITAITNAEIDAIVAAS